MSEQLPKPTAIATLRSVAVLAAAGLRPATRAISTATLFDRIAEIGGDAPLTVADLVAGLVISAQPRLPVEPDNIAQRRTLCAQIVGILFASYGDLCKHGDAARWATVLDIVANFIGDSSDPYRASIRDLALWQSKEVREDIRG